MAAPIRIRIGASVDSSVDKAFATVEAKAKKAYANTLKDAQRAGQGQAKAADGVAGEWGKAAGKAQQSTDRLTRGVVRSWEQIGKVAERELNRQSRAVFRESEKQRRYVEDANRRAGESFARRTSYTAARFLAPHAPIGSIARRAAADIARGAGVDLSVGSSIGRSVELEARATALSNQAYQPGAQGPNGIRQDAKGLVGEARKIGGDLAFNPADVLEGLEKFTNKTGDLQTGRDILKDIAALAGATGTNLADAVDAAGDISNGLGDVPNKGARIVDVMKTIAGQGKLGAVEMKDFATQMAKIAANAPRLEGDAGDNIKQLGALAQFARARGGATSAQQAATSVARLVDTLVTPARAKAFGALGIKTTTAEGKVRNPIAVILEALRATKGNPIEFKKLFASSIGSRPADALATTFRNAGGGETGIAAVGAELTKFIKDASVDDKQIAENNAARLETTAAKVQQFQNRLDETGDHLRVALLPAFEQLAPKVLGLAGTLGNLVAWAAAHPLLAAGGALAVSGVRAGLESTVRAGIESALLGKGGTNAAGLGVAAGSAGGALTLAAVAVASFSVTSMVVETLFAKSQEDQKKKVENDVSAFNDLQAAKRLGVNADPEALKKFIATREADVEEGGGKHLGRSLMDDFFTDLARIPGLGGAEAAQDALRARDASEKMVLEQQRRELAESKALLSRILGALNKLPPAAPAIPGRVGQ
jgi:hypothetical protein